MMLNQYKYLAQDLVHSKHPTIVPLFPCQHILIQYISLKSGQTLEIISDTAQL